MGVAQGLVAAAKVYAFVKYGYDLAHASPV
jgi:hypothetical protein